MRKCTAHNCNLDTFENEENCILHCKKSDYSTDFHKIGFLSSFFEEFINSIVNQLFEHTDLLEETFNKEEILNYLSKYDLQDNEIDKVLKTAIIIPSSINFPARDGRDYFDYLRVLNKFGRIHFNYCQFYISYLELENVECFFQDCIFYTYWTIYNYGILKNVNNVIYQNCEFHKEITGYHSDDNEKYSIYNHSQFHACIFHQSISFENSKFLKMLFNDLEDSQFSSEINEILFEKCIFDGKFILNTHRINYFKCKQTIFNKKFEFRDNIVQEFEIYDCNFYDIVYFYKSIFEKFNIYKSIFEKFVAFELCEFGSTSDSINKDLISKFQYVTFLDFINFRKSKFHNGLDIANTNIKDMPNFLDIYVSFLNTDRETFRIIKNSFDQSGNYIEGNKFFSDEMKKYKEELKKKPWKNHVQEKIVFLFNDKISNFGKNYIQPIAWILFFVICYNFISYGYEKNYLYSYPSLNPYIRYITDLLNDGVKTIKPLEKILKEGMEFISLLFYIIFSILIWQTVVALKRHTKR